MIHFTPPLRLGLMLGVSAVYLFIMFLGANLLPERFSHDAQLLSQLLEEEPMGTGGAYEWTAYLFGLIPEGARLPLIATIGVACIALLCGSVSNLWGALAVGVMLVPLLTTALMRMQKELFVVLLVGALLAGVLRAQKHWLALAVIVGLYATYGLVVRPYFVLILAVFLGLYLLHYAGPVGKWLLVTLGVVVVLALPVGVYEMLQGPRDTVNMLRVAGIEGNNTFFNNPYPVDGALNFMLNYVYALVRLNIPVLFHQTPQALFLLGFMAMSVGLLVLAWRRGTWHTQMLASLFAAHMVILPLFEPDLGSYLRHISSVILYLWPALLLWQQRFAPLPTQHPFLRFNQARVIGERIEDKG